MILHVITNLTEIGGAENSMKRFIASCPQYGHGVVSLMGVAEVEADALQTLGVSVIALGIGSAAGMVTGAFGLARQIARWRPRVIMCWMYHANFVGLLAARLADSGLPVIWNVRHSLEDIASESRSTKMAIYANRLLGERVDGIIYCSRRAQAQHEAFGFSARRSVYIPNGYVFPRAPPERGPIAPGGRLVIGAAGRLHPAKDYPTLLAAAARVLRASPRAEFVLAGRDITWDNPKFATMLAATGIDTSRVRAIGQVSDMAKFYAGLDLLVLSSITEGFPNVLAEAMGHGVPVVTTDVGDAAEIVGACGRVVTPRKPNELATAILDMLALPDGERLALGRRAWESVAIRYGIDSVVARYLDFMGLVRTRDDTVA
jgi:glycosyltransferase involved in cell wall biosynthesis